MKIIKCANCTKEKPTDKYLMGWQRKHRVYNYCKDHHGVRGAVTKKVDPSKIYSCLRCEDKFKSVKNVRICVACKLSHEFEGDKLIQYISQTTGVIA